MRAHVNLKLQPAERAALRLLEPEERDAVIDDLMIQVREDLEWMVARATVREEPPPLPVPLRRKRIA